MESLDFNKIIDEYVAIERAKDRKELQILKMVATRRKNGSYISHNKGKRLSEETKNKMKLAILRKKEAKTYVHPCLGKRMSNETKQKISEANRGMIRSEESKQKISNALIGRRFTVETKEKMSLSKLGKRRHDSVKRKISETRKQRFKEGKILHHFLGKHLSDEHKKKLLLANKGKRWSEEQKLNRCGEKNPRWNGGGKLSRARANHKRRLLGFIRLNNSFDGADAHHIDKEHVIFIPNQLHRSVHHSLDKPETMECINTKAFCWILGFNNK